MLTLAAPAPGLTATMTFADTLWEDFAPDYPEDGIDATALGGVFGAYVADVQHMDDMAADGPSAIQFRMAGRIDAISFDLLPVAFDDWLCNDETMDCTSPTYENVRVEGFRAGSVVASLALDMGLIGAATVQLGAAFRDLDYLEIGVILPPLGPFNGPLSADCGYPCSHFEIDKVTLALAPLPVPLPAAMFPLASGGALLAAVALRGRRRKA